MPEPRGSGRRRKMARREGLGEGLEAGTGSSAPIGGGSAPGDPGEVDRDAFEVLAGGGLVWRPVAGPQHVDGRGPDASGGPDVGGESDVEILVVHRPRYDDWSFPKGKIDRGESLRACALREVAEETGMRCALGRHLVDVTYVDRRGRTKLVRYWAMTVETDGHGPDDEVDEMRWLAPAEVRRLLSYERDQAVIDAFLSR